MAEYNLFVNAEVDEANRKLENIDKKLESIDKKAGNIDIQFPSLDQVVKGFKAAGDAIKFVWDNSDGLIANINPLWSALGDVKDLLGLLTEGAQDFGTELKKLKKVMPTTIVGTGFEAATNAINNTAQATARLGYVFFGLQQSVNLVAGTFNSFFDNTIARQAQLEATILQTRTTLASTARVLADGMELRDPLQAIQALEGPIEETITNIRRRSLEIAGTTSEAIIQTFSVVAGQIGQIGGDLKDAEDLAISFAAALGTIGLSNPMYATQEIRSILSGNIDQNSVLARSLGITNEDVQKAKSSAEGLVSWLEKRLAAFGAGQKIAATQLSGVLSNVLEVWQEFSRELGKPLLQPLLDAANAVFGRLSSVFKELLNFAESIGYAFTSLYQIVQQVFASSDFNLVSDKQIAEGLNSLSMMIGDFLASIEAKLQSYIVPMLVRALNNIKKIIDTLLPSVVRLVAAFAQFKLLQLEVVVDSFEFMTQIIKDLAPAIQAILDLYTGLMSQPLLQYLSQMAIYIKFFEDNGFNAFARLSFSLLLSIGSIKKIVSAVKAAWTFISAIPGQIVSGVKTATASIEINVKSLIVRIIQLLAQIGQIITAAVSNAAVKIKVALVEIATQAQASGTAVGQAITQGALAAAGAADALAKGMGGANKAMQNLEKNAPGIADAMGKPYIEAKKNVQNLATSINTNLVAGLKKLRTMLWSTIKSMAWFSIQMALITVVIGAAVQAWSKWKEGVQNDKEIRAGINANEKLATSLKDVNEESSKFMQAQKARAIEQRNKAIENLQKNLQDLEKQYIKAQATVKAFEDLPPGSTRSRYGFDSEGAAQKAKEVIKRVQDYRNQLEDLYRDIAAEEERKEDMRTIQILNKERTGLEKKIAKEREKVERALADYQFRLRQSMEQKVFAQREAEFRVELQRIQQAQQLAKSGMTGVARAVADIIDDYNNEMLRVEQERQKREFDLKQQIARLEKDVADYEFKLKEQQAKIAKQVGNFNTKVADYELKQARVRHEEEMRATIKMAKLRNQGFVQYADQIESFKNEAAGRGISATNLLSFLYAGGGQNLGISPEMEPGEMMDILRKNFNDFDEIFAAGNNDFNEWLRTFVAALGKAQASADFARQSAREDLGTTFKQASPAAPPKLENLAFETKEFVDERRRANEQLIASQEKLNATLDRTAKAIAGLKLNQFGDRSLLTDLPTTQTLTENVTRARLRLIGAQQAGSLGGRMDPTALNETMIRLNATIAKAGIENSKLKPDEKSRALSILENNLQQTLQSLPEINKMLKEIAQIDLLTQLENDIATVRREGFESMIEAANEALSAFTALGEASERRVAQINIENAVAQKQREMLAAGIEMTDEAIKALADYRKELEKTADQQEELRQFLKPLIERLQLVKEAAATLTEAYKDAAKSLLSGGDIKEVSRNFAQALAGKTIDSFVEWVFKDMQKQLEDIFGQFMGLENVEEQIRDKLESFKTEANTNARETITAINQLGSRMEAAITNAVQTLEINRAPDPQEYTYDAEGRTSQQRRAMEVLPQGDGNVYGPNTSANDPRYPLGQVVGSFGGQGGPNSGLPISLPVEPFQEAANNIVPLTKNLTEGAESLGRAAQQAAPEIAAAAEKTSEQATAAQNVQGALAGATQMLLGIGMVASGISQIQEGGTSNTLLGIGQVLMGVGSFGLGLGRMPFFAQGGYVNSPTVGMIGEGGQGEYIIPENKMASSMQKWSMGARGKDVLDGSVADFGSQNRSMAQPTSLGSASRRYNPGNNYNSTTNYNSGDGGSADNFSINITGDQLVFNERNYVSQDEIPSIISQASKQGEARTLRKLRMSQTARGKVGIS